MTPAELSEDNDVINYEEQKCDQLIQLVHELRDQNKALNILFIGTAGVGKSSAINTIATAVTEEKYREYAISGADVGTASQTTHRLQIIQGDKYGRHNKEFFRGVKLPNLIDMAGFQDEDTPLNEELLRAVLYGRLHSGESFTNAQRLLRESGLIWFKLKYGYFSKVKKEHKIDRIVVIASAVEPVPKSLINCVRKASHNTTKRGGNRDVPIFGLMTKTDRVDMSSVEFKEREDSFKDALQITGQQLRYAAISSYCDETDATLRRRKQCIPKIDVPILEFMNQVCSHSYEVQADKESYPTIHPVMMMILILAVLLIFVACLLAR